MSRGTSSVAQFCRDHKINRCATLLEVNDDIWRLMKLVRKLQLDQKFLIRQTKEFSRLVFKKLALESSLGLTPQSGCSDIQVLKILLGRTKAVSRYLDPQLYGSVKNSPALLSWMPSETPKGTVDSKAHMRRIYLSRRRGRDHLAKLQLEHLRLDKSNYGVKQLLLRFDEDIALLKNDVKLLRQHPPALDAVQALDTWTKLARVELCFMSDAEKRRSIASQRRVSALSTRRLSMTGSRASLRDSSLYTGRDFADGRTQNPDITGNRESPLSSRQLVSEPSRYRLSQHVCHEPNSESSENNLSSQGQSDSDAQLSKRISILSLGKRSGAILSDWKWDGDDSDNELGQDSGTQSIADHSADATAPSMSTQSNTSVNTSSDSRSRSTQTSSEESVNKAKPMRPRSYITPRSRYSMYDQYGRKKVPCQSENGLSSS